VRFDLTPDELRPLAEVAAEWLSVNELSVYVEVAVADDAPGKTTLLGLQKPLSVLVEVQRVPAYSGVAQDIMRYLAIRRMCAEFYIAVDSDAHIAGSTLRELQRDGVGLLLIGTDDSIHISAKATNPALQITLDPNLSCGRLNRDVRGIFDRFNSGERKPAVDDMVEMVEELVRRIAVKAAAKKLVKKDVAVMEKADWATRVNVLESAELVTDGGEPVLSEEHKDDLHSFRNSRNLFKHPVATRRAALKREIQYPERMHMGARLVSELLRIERKIR